MGCNCGGGGARRSPGVQVKWMVTTASGEEKGPFLTQVEARMAVTAAGGGTIKPVT